MTLPSYFLPLIKSIKVDAKVTMLAKMESYELFVQTIKDRQLPSKKNFWKKEQKARITSTEQALVDALLESQVELPSKLVYGAPASEKLAELYFQNVLKFWSGIKATTITAEGADLLKYYAPVRFTAPKIDGIDLKPGTGMILNNFKTMRLVNDDYKFYSKVSDKLSTKYNVNVEADEILRDMTYNPAWEKYIDIYEIASTDFWFKKFAKFTYTAITILLATLVTLFVMFGLATLFVLLMSVAAIMMMGMISLVVCEFNDWDYFFELTYIKTTPLGRQLAEEALPWDRFSLGAGDKKGYLALENMLG